MQMTIADLFRVTPTETAKRRNSGEFWRLPDVRDPRELNVAQVADSVAIPMEQIANRVGELNPEDPVAVLCHTGERCAVVAAWLLGHGFACVAKIERA